MSQKKCQLNKTSIEFIQKLCRNAHRLENEIPNRELQQLIYNIGVYTYRQSFGAGFPENIRFPATTAPRKVWVNEQMRYVSEADLVSA
tara:strand:- start:8 stop:271 length:264 start_codon:yes stop_codon:yes gene_type:complete